jgi:hypothetical protein
MPRRSVDDLMATLAGIARLPTYQLSLPVTARDYRQQQHTAALTGATL